MIHNACSSKTTSSGKGQLSSEAKKVAKKSDLASKGVKLDSFFSGGVIPPTSNICLKHSYWQPYCDNCKREADKVTGTKESDKND